MNDTDRLLLVEVPIQRISKEVLKLRKAVEDGIYGPREIVGDAVLILEGQLKQINEIIEESKNPRHH